MRIRCSLALFLAALLLAALPLFAQGETPPAQNEESPPDDEGMLDEPIEEKQPEAEALPGEEEEVKSAEERDAGEEEETRSIIIDVAVTLNYIFENLPDNFVIKYSFHMEGKTAARTAVVKGDVEVTSEVEGYLAKWPTGECKLSVAIPKVPFQMTFNKTNDEKGRLNIRFQRKFVETWQSTCSFTDAPGKHFDTRGDPEEWLAKALEKARPPFSALALQLDPKEATTTTFTIAKQTLKDPPLGTAEIEGTGVITVKPGVEE